MPFHLCQPGTDTSCGACCGLYNFRDHSREAVTRALVRRTEALAAVPLEPLAWRAVGRSLHRWDKDPLFPPVKVCPLLGFVDPGRKRVGCLGHPAVTGGIDLRDCGAYDSRTCSTFECPSFIWLTAEMATLVRDACPDFYVYGLVVTDVEWVRTCIKLIELEVAAPVNLEVIRTRPAALAAMSRLFALKETAPGRSADASIFGRFAADENGEPVPRMLDYAALESETAPEDDGVLCLGYDPGSPFELQAARSVIRSAVLEVVELL